MSSPSYTKKYDGLKNFLSRSSLDVFCALVDLMPLRSNHKLTTLAAKSGFCVRSVKYALADLRKKGLIEVFKGQRASTYKVAPISRWEEILKGKICPTGPSSVGQELPHRRGKKCPTEPHPPYKSSEPISNPNRGVHVITTSIVRRVRKADPPVPVFEPQRLLEEVCEIYELAGRPVAQKHRQLAVQLMLSMEVAERDRLPKRLPDYLKWATLYLWSDPQHTKSLLNVLRDGDWDVDLTMRKVPVPRKPSVMEEQKRIFLESQR